MKNRSEITEWLTKILINTRLNDRKYFAREVTVDYGTTHPKRVDIMQFIPEGTTYESDIEKGIFVCYEIKSCIEDVYSGHGLNFLGEKNYIVTTMETYKKLLEDIHVGKLRAHIQKLNNVKGGNRFPDFGILVAVPDNINIKNSNEIYDEFSTPHKPDINCKTWKLWTAESCKLGRRDRSISELLFCMLRSKHSYTNSIDI